MKRISVLLACLALVTGFASCTKDDGGTVVDNGKPTYMQVNVSFPLITRAVNDPKATLSEVKLTSVDVFIFDATNNTLAKHQKLGASDFNPLSAGLGNNDRYAAITKVATTTGAKKIYVGINLPSNFPAVTSVGTLKAAWKMSQTDLVTTDGIAMFSVAEVNKTLVEPDDANYSSNNVFTVDVERMVAKVAVEDGGFNPVLADGVVSDFSFAICNSNKQIFPVKHMVGDVVTDPNWANGSYIASDFENFSDYITIDVAGTSGLNGINSDRLKAKYAPENTTESHLQKETTYASIRAKFVPNEFTKADGTLKSNNVGQSAKTFWIVSFANGSRKYFDAVSDATTYAANNGGTVSDAYVNGYCYYQAYFNPTSGYNLIRNHFYHVKINKINGPGKTDPNPKDPDQPVETPTDILVSINVVAWTFLLDYYELN